MDKIASSHGFLSKKIYHALESKNKFEKDSDWFDIPSLSKSETCDCLSRLDHCDLVLDHL